MSSVLLVKTAVRGYHVYQGVWEPARGDLFVCLHESENRHDRYAMAVYRSETPGVVVGHLPKEISKMCYYFIRHDGKISGKVTGRRQYSEEAGAAAVTLERFVQANIKRLNFACAAPWNHCHCDVVIL